MAFRTGIDRETWAGRGSAAQPWERKSLPVKRVQRSSVQEDVYRQARDLILNGGLAPGQSITIQWLADAFGVSAMPVREAILRLTAENALTVVAGRSLGIPRLTRERLKDLTRTRLEIEPLAVSWAVPAIDESMIARLEDLTEKMGEVEPTMESRARYLRANREFHFAIYRASGSDSLLAIIENLWLQVSPYFNFLQEHGNFVDSNHHHRALVQALRRRDRGSARTALRNDIRKAARVLEAVAPPAAAALAEPT